MRKDTDMHAEREEIEMLLPWYVMGRLDHDDMARVEAHLVRDEALRRQAQLVREEHVQSLQGNEAIAARPARNADRLLAAIAVRPAPRAPVIRSPWERIKDLLVLPSAGGIRWAAAAAALLIVVQAGMLADMNARQHGTTYMPAAGAAAAREPGTLALTAFVASATTSDMADVLAALDMTIVDGPSAGGLFTVRIGPRAMSEADRQAKLQALKSRRDLVAGVVLLR